LWTTSLNSHQFFFPVFLFGPQAKTSGVFPSGVFRGALPNPTMPDSAARCNGKRPNKSREWSASPSNLASVNVGRIFQVKKPFTLEKTHISCKKKDKHRLKNAFQREYVSSHECKEIKSLKRCQLLRKDGIDLWMWIRNEKRKPVAKKRSPQMSSFYKLLRAFVGE